MQSRTWSKIGTFYVLTLLLVLPLEWLNHHAQGNGTRTLTTAVMWSPALAAVITLLLFREDIGTLGWRWGSWRYICWGLFIPVLYALPAYLAIWVSGVGGFYNSDFVAAASRDYGFGGTSAGFLGFVLVVITAGLIQSISRALGEELGWRGFLVPQLAKVCGFTGVCLISGLLWAAWHYPAMLLGEYSSATTPAWYQFLCFTVMTTSMAFIAAWLRLRSGSVWPAVMLHSMHNTIVQPILTPLTTNTGHTDWYIDEFGAVLAVTMLIGAIIVWWKRADLAGAVTGK